MGQRNIQVPAKAGFDIASIYFHARHSIILRRAPRYVLIIAVFGLIGCLSPETHLNATFIVLQGSGNDKEAPWIPTGDLWVPNSKIEISVYGEPRIENNEVVTSEWRSAGFVTADNRGSFGYPGNFTILVQRKIPGSPPAYHLAAPLVLARDAEHNIVKTSTIPLSEWFTFGP